LPLPTDLASRHEMSVHSKPQVSTLSTLGMISALQLIFLFFLQENELRKALIPFIGVRMTQEEVKGQFLINWIRLALNL